MAQRELDHLPDLLDYVFQAADIVVCDVREVLHLLHGLAVYLYLGLLAYHDRALREHLRDYERYGRAEYAHREEVALEDRLAHQALLHVLVEADGVAHLLLRREDYLLGGLGLALLYPDLLAQADPDVLPQDAVHADHVQALVVRMRLPHYGKGRLLPCELDDVACRDAQ